MSSIPDLVLDTKLDTKFQGHAVVHTNFDVQQGSQRRSRVTEKWERHRALGVGGFGTVWLEKRVDENAKGQLRAVKEIRKMKPTEWEHWRELEALAKFSQTKYSHLFVRSFGWFESPSSIFITMEYMASGDLQNYIRTQGAVTEGDAQIIVAQVLEGLTSMHENHFVHRDIKPSNMMLVRSGPEWWVKLIDFGISKRNINSLSTIVAGTPSYMAPENLGFSGPNQSPEDSSLGDRQVAPAQDLWALGVSAFFLLTGELPFSRMADTLHYVVNTKHFPLEILVSQGVSIACCEFIKSLLAANPRDRPTSYEAQRHAWLQEIQRESLEFNDVSVVDSVEALPGTYPQRLSEHTFKYGATDVTTIASQDETFLTRGAVLEAIATEEWTVPQATIPRILPEEIRDGIHKEVLTTDKLPLTSQRPGSVSSAQLEAVEDKKLMSDPIPSPQSQGVSSGVRPSAPAHPSAHCSPSAHIPQYETGLSSSSDTIFTKGNYQQNTIGPGLKFPAVSYSRRFSVRRSVHFTISSSNTLAPKPSHLNSTTFSPPGTNPLPFSISSEPVSLFSGVKANTEMNEHGHHYQYDRLDKRQIRLLRLHRGKIDDPIQCSLQIFSVPGTTQNEVPPYTAISYAWGTDEPSKKIRILTKDFKSDLDSPIVTQDMGSSSVIMVRDNLFAALKQLRREETGWWFWIDAICINQESDDEKSHQLPKLLHIYSHAYNVCVWLGESVENNENHTARIHPFDFIPNIINLRALDTMLSTRSGDLDLLNGWTSFASLLRAPWFRRRWVIQEIAASTRAFVQIGTRSVDWFDFSDAIELFLSKIEPIRSMFAKKALHSESEALSHIEASGAAAIVSTTNNLIRKTEQGVILDRLLNIETLVSTFKHFEATNPSDIVYALLPLAHDGHGPERAMTLTRGVAPLTPDYSQPYWNVYMDFVRHSVQTARSLDIICREWAPHIPTEGFKGKYRSLPSWIQVVDKSPFDQGAEQTGRLTGESLVGSSGKPVYNASRGMQMFARFTEDATEDPNVTEMVLWVRGVKLSTISRKSDRVLHGIISKESLHLAGWSGGNYDELSDRVWRTLTADRDVDGKHTPYWFRRACQLCLTKTHDGDLNTSRLLSTKLLPDTVMTYLRRVEAVVWNRRFFECASATDGDTNFFGLGPRDLQEGDIVCILFGCSVPVVLREVAGFKSPGYKLVGECYVHGYMDGEALAGLDDAVIDGAALNFNLR